MIEVKSATPEGLERHAKPAVQAVQVGPDEAVYGSAADLLGDIELPRRSDGRDSKLDQAIAWIKNALASGTVSSAELWEAAKQAGISKATYRRAREALGLAPQKGGFDAGWHVGLPN